MYSFYLMAQAYGAPLLLLAAEKRQVYQPSDWWKSSGTVDAVPLSTRYFLVLWLHPQRIVMIK